MTHDAHAKPPDSVRELFKIWRQQSNSQSPLSNDLIDPYDPDPRKTSFLSLEIPGQTELETMTKALFDDLDLSAYPDAESPRTAFSINGLHGLQVFPSLFSPRLQVALLEKLLHRDLSNPKHRTNVHIHHHVQYPPADKLPASSFFSADPTKTLEPKDSKVHKSISYARMLGSKLRWITLGGQYDWTNKHYPDETPPAFPPDIAGLLKQFFPTVDPQAAIVNFYNPGDTLSIHRDVSEACDRALVSISIGCDGIFVAGNDNGSEVAAIRLRSGDAIVMSGESRYAWHGVPKILANTCPAWLQGWPDVTDGSPYQQWRGWLGKKRINLNVRQMKE